MQGWSPSVAESTYHELRRVRKESERTGRAPLRILIAGNPTKPVLTFTIPGWAPLALLTAGIVCGCVGMIFRSRTVQAASLSAHVGWYRPARAVPLQEPSSAAETDVRFLRQRAPEQVAQQPERDPAQQTRPQELPTAQAPSEQIPTQRAEDLPAVQTPSEPTPTQGANEFTLHIVNTGKAVPVRLVGPAREPDEASYRRLRHELRCQRTGAEYPIDPRLIELLYEISTHASQPVHVISAYRAPAHFSDLNFHARGMAADIRIPGMSAAEVRELAQSLGARGIGYYPTAQFVHVDVRDVAFSWTDTSGHGNQPPRYESPDVLEPTASTPSLPAPSAMPALGDIAPPAMPALGDIAPATSAWSSRRVQPVRGHALQ